MHELVKQRQLPRLPQLDHLQGQAQVDLATDGNLEQSICSNLLLGPAEALRYSVDESVLRRVTVVESKLLQTHLTDTRLEHCDFSNVDMTESMVTRCEAVDTKITGLKLNEAALEDVLFKECKADYTQFQQVKAKRVVFDHCNLQEAYFNEADLRGVIFDSCDLTRADFSKAKLLGANFRGSTIEGMRIDLNFLSGVQVDLSQAIYIAQLLGLEIE